MGALQAVLDNGAKIELDHHLVYYARTSCLSSSLPSYFAQPSRRYPFFLARHMQFIFPDPWTSRADTFFLFSIRSMLVLTRHRPGFALTLDINLSGGTRTSNDCPYCARFVSV